MTMARTTTKKGLGATCLHPGCDALPKARGLCMPHYHVAHRLIRKGKTTWDKLVVARKALAAPKPSRWFLESAR